MYKVKVKITGASPLRHNRFLHRNKDKADPKKMTEEEQKQDAMTRAYFDEDKGFYVPAINMHKCIVEGAISGNVRVSGKGSGKRMKASLLFEDDRIYLKTKDYDLQSDQVRIPPGTGARFTKYWVVHKEWSLEFVLIVLDDLLPVGAVEDALTAAGLFGLMDGRPYMGKFTVDKTTRIKNK